MKNIWISHNISLIAGKSPVDRITLKLDLRTRLIEMNQCQAILRRPVVLARDSRFNDGFVDETSQIISNNGFVELTPVENLPFPWLEFTMKAVLGTDLEGNDEVRTSIYATSLLPEIPGIKD